MRLFARFVEESDDGLFGYVEFLDEKTREVFPIESGGKGELGIVELDARELDDLFGDLFAPVAFAALDHSHGEPVKRDVEDMLSAVSTEPCGESAEFIVSFEKENLVSAARQDVRRRHPRQTRSNDDHVVSIGIPFRLFHFAHDVYALYKTREKPPDNERKSTAFRRAPSAPTSTILISNEKI